MLDNKQQINRVILSLSIVIVYLIVSFHLAYDTKFISDTIYYRKVFYNINENPMPYGVECIIPTMMYIIHKLGLSFEFFIFFILMLWVPLIFITANKVSDNISYFCIVLFFFSVYFAPNVVIIRQYVGCLFFLYYLYYKERKISYIFLFLSFTSHVSLIMWWLCSKVYFYDHILKRKSLSLLLVIGAFLISYIISKFSFQSVNFDILSNVLPSVIESKLRYYQDVVNVNPPVSNLSIIMILALAVLTIYADVKSPFYKRITSLVFFQCVLFLLLKDNIVAATRFGMFSFFFSIPLMIIYLNKYVLFGSLKRYKNMFIIKRDHKL